MSLKLCLKCLLFIQLFFLIFRQIIDFSGIQWTCIIVNFVAILVTISALFHYSLLLYYCFQFLLIFYNLFVILLYLEISMLHSLSLSVHALALDHNARSFWYTIVGHMFDHNNQQQSRDEQLIESFVNYIEIIQSFIHLIISLVLLILISIHFRNERRIRLKQNSKSESKLKYFYC